MAPAARSVTRASARHRPNLLVRGSNRRADDAGVVPEPSDVDRRRYRDLVAKLVHLLARTAADDSVRWLVLARKRPAVDGVTGC